MIVISAGILLCKAVALGLILLFMYIKGKQFHFEAKQWDAWLLHVDEKKLFRMITAVYLLSSALSSAAAYGVLNHFCFRYAPGIALIFFVARVAATWLRYQRSGKEYFTNQIEKLHKIILKNS